MKHALGIAVAAALTSALVGCALNLDSGDTAPSSPVAEAPDAAASLARAKDGQADAGALSNDSGAAVDAGPNGCLERLQLPGTPSWIVWAKYASKSVAYRCSGGDGDACRAALQARYNPATESVYPGVCHIPVPAECIPCTGFTTEW